MFSGMAANYADYADLCNLRNLWLPITFEVEKMLFAPEAAAVASEFSILINNAMTRNHDGNAVPAIRGTDGTLRVCHTDAAGEIFIRTGFSIRNA
jgi:hypothetical protein